jgi:hypothetical protein
MSDADWVEDVRRWYFSARGASPGTPAAPVAAPAAADEDALGYEAADPVLQARNWPDAALVAETAATVTP